jgi:hypothetical protein
MPELRVERLNHQIDISHSIQGPQIGECGRHSQPGANRMLPPLTSRLLRVRKRWPVRWRRPSRVPADALVPALRRELDCVVNLAS